MTKAKARQRAKAKAAQKARKREAITDRLGNARDPSTKALIAQMGL